MTKLTPLIFLTLAAAQPPSTPPQPWPGITRTDLQRHDLSAPGREVLQARVDFAPGSSFPRHKHPGEEIIYVIEGTLEYELPDKGWVPLREGDVLYVPAGGVHAARNRGTAPAAELATYVLIKGQPLTEFVE